MLSKLQHNTAHNTDANKHIHQITFKEMNSLFKRKCFVTNFIHCMDAKNIFSFKINTTPIHFIISKTIFKELTSFFVSTPASFALESTLNILNSNLNHFFENCYVNSLFLKYFSLEDLLSLN